MKTNVQLIQTRNEVKNKETGETKRYTNFKLRINIGNRYVDVPIRPVDFGQEANRKNYTMLLSVADPDTPKETKEDKESMPF